MPLGGLDRISWCLGPVTMIMLQSFVMHGRRVFDVRLFLLRPRQTDGGQALTSDLCSLLPAPCSMLLAPRSSHSITYSLPGGYELILLNLSADWQATLRWPHWANSVFRHYFEARYTSNFARSMIAPTWMRKSNPMMPSISKP